MIDAFQKIASNIVNSPIKRPRMPDNCILEERRKKKANSESHMNDIADKKNVYV